MPLNIPFSLLYLSIHLMNLYKKKLANKRFGIFFLASFIFLYYINDSM